MTGIQRTTFNNAKVLSPIFIACGVKKKTTCSVFVTKVSKFQWVEQRETKWEIVSLSHGH